MVDQFDVIGVHVSYVSHDFLAVLTLPIFLNECSFEVPYFKTSSIAKRK